MAAPAVLKEMFLEEADGEAGVAMSLVRPLRFSEALVGSDIRWGLLTERVITEGVRVSAPASTKDVVLMRGAIRSPSSCEGQPPSLSRACSCATE
jgi:hypothetical protein